MTEKKKAESEKEPASGYSKSQMLASKQFTPQRKDMLQALLRDGQKYTKQQVHKTLEDFLKRKVT